jgi:hypothetical protein
MRLDDKNNKNNLSVISNVGNTSVIGLKRQMFYSDVTFQFSASVQLRLISNLLLLYAVNNYLCKLVVSGGECSACLPYVFARAI